MLGFFETFAALDISLTLKKEMPIIKKEIRTARAAKKEGMGQFTPGDQGLEGRRN